jgi:hypothetical protein
MTKDFWKDYVPEPSKPAPVQEPVEPSNVKAALCFALWHHMGASSSIGQPIRKMLGLGQHDHLSAFQFSEAQRINTALEAPPAAQPAVPLTDEQIIDIRRKTTAKTHGEWADTKAFARAIEAAHGITKGQP